MPPDMLALFLLLGSLGAVASITVTYCRFGYPQNRITLMVTLLLVYALLTLAPLVLLRQSQI